MTDAAADVEIIRFDPDRDDAELFALFARIVEAGEGCPHDAPLSRADHDGLRRSPVATVTVARSEGRLVGAYYLKPNDAGKASHIANAGYVVDASVRGLGLGRRLVAHSIEAAPGLGFDASCSTSCTSPTPPARCTRRWAGNRSAASPTPSPARPASSTGGPCEPPVRRAGMHSSGASGRPTGRPDPRRPAGAGAGRPPRGRGVAPTLRGGRPVRSR